MITKVVEFVFKESRGVVVFWISTKTGEDSGFPDGPRRKIWGCNIHDSCGAEIEAGGMGLEANANRGNQATVDLVKVDEGGRSNVVKAEVIWQARILDIKFKP